MARKYKLKKKKENKEKKIPLIERVADGLDIPKETVYNLPFITMFGNKEVKVENFSSILAYGEHVISLKTQCGVLSIEGIALEARHMDSEQICIRGNIKSIAFIK